jgi:hypothetical protein
MSTFSQADEWGSEFAESTLFSFLPTTAKESAPVLCAEFLRRTGEMTDSAIRRVMLEEMPLLDVPPEVRKTVPETLGRFFDWLEDSGRLGGGRTFALQIGALAPAYHERCSPQGGLRVPPIVNKSKEIGRNDPCPCGSGRKFKKCCKE